MTRVYPSGSSSTPSVAVVTLTEGSTTSVPPPPLQPIQASGAAQKTRGRRREPRCDTGDIAALHGRLAAERGSSIALVGVGPSRFTPDHSARASAQLRT